MPRPKKQIVYPDVTLIETWNMAMVRELLQLAGTPFEVATVLKGACKANHGGQIQVGYNHSEATPGRGRLYASGPAIQRLPEQYRRLALANGHYLVQAKHCKATLRLAMGAELAVEKDE